MLELDIEDSKSDEYEIKLLESFSLNLPSLKYDSCMKSEIKSNLDRDLSMCNCLLPNLCRNLRQPLGPDEHYDHTYSITSSHSYRQRQHTPLNECFISCCQRAANNPSIITTGDLAMTIVNNDATVIPTNPLEPEKMQSKVGKSSNNKYKEKSTILSNNNYRSTRSRKKSSIIHVIQPTDFCVHCHEELYPNANSMKSSVFCLKTGNVSITCWNCSTTMSIKGAFKLPKLL